MPAYVYNMQYCDNPAVNTVAAYILKYNSIGAQGNNPCFVDIPVQSPAAGFLFTGELSGCSLVVTQRNNDHYRVYHDSRHNSSVLHNNVIMAVDHCDYAKDYEDQIPRKIDVATACMHYKNNSWNLYAQCLNENEEPANSVGPRDVPDSKRVLRWKGASPVIFRNSSMSYTAPNIENDREVLYQYLRSIAVEHLGAAKVPNEVDGPFVPFNPQSGPDMENSYVRRTQALRHAIVRANLDAKLRQQMRDHDFRTFQNKLSASKSIDITYLWLKMKREGGTVVRDT